jgi:amino acid transporter
MELATSRPRVLGWLRSAAILDGDWGTSIAYVLGIAFALAGYHSGWHLMMMLAFTIMVSINYITICRMYPSGGGVYSAVSHRSRSFAVVGALLLSADFVVTASLSVLEACHYFGLSNAGVWAIVIIALIGVLNWFGPRHAGALAILISVATLAALAVLVASAAPTAIQNIHIEPAPGGLLENWRIFVGIILAISGIESISNMTGIMKDPLRSSRRAILSVLAKIVIVTIVLGLAMNAVPNLHPTGHTEDMLRFLGEHFIGEWFGPVIGIVLGFLLISAGNTAINALTSIQFMMSVDGELPHALRRLNRYGVPVIPLAIATMVPIIVLVLVHDVITLAQLYAIGVVGAILINVASTGTDPALTLSRRTRAFMIASAVVLFLVESTIAIEKTKALVFAATVLAIGLAARALARKQAQAVQIPTIEHIAAAAIPTMSPTAGSSFESRIMVSVRGGNERLLRHACDEAKLRKAFLFVLHITRVSVVGLLPDKIPSEAFGDLEWMDKICKEYGIPYRILNIISNEVGYTIAENAATFGVDRLILGSTQRSLVDQALRGDILKTVSALLPEEIQLVIYRA